MQPINYIQAKLSVFVVLGFTFLFASCGSYQYVGYDNDGIYTEDVAVTEENRTVPVENTESSSVYKDYFTEKEIQYGEIPDDGSAIFTDIDSYSSAYDDQYIDEEGQAGWGAANENVTVNFYNTGWNNWGWNRFGFGWYNAYWGSGPLGWNGPWGWDGSFLWGYNNWGWNYGYGFNNFWCPPSYYYGNGLRNNRIAYNYGRRGVNLNRNSLSRRNYSNLSRRNTTSYRNRTTLRSRDNRSSTIRSRNSRSTVIPRTTTRSRIRSNGTVRPRTTTRSSRSTTTRNNSSVRSSRSSSSSRSNMSSSRRSSSGSSMRSSSGSSRSSGSRSSGRRR